MPSTTAIGKKYEKLAQTILEGWGYAVEPAKPSLYRKGRSFRSRGTDHFHLFDHICLHPAQKPLFLQVKSGVSESSTYTAAKDMRAAHFLNPSFVDVRIWHWIPVAPGYPDGLFQERVLDDDFKLNRRRFVLPGDAPEAWRTRPTQETLETKRHGNQTRTTR